ncbi:MULTISPECIES: porin family protein [Pseudoalteromonas]|uniref:Porin family protein n=1 Tax=Pseudoalteromonas haloplanktis TaxID=228 RepID=A0ABU1BBQ2_PSEHA|nr:MULTISPECIES: porin family protein [Pseudoalteromonas]MCF6143807.1 hypothetical protein [Pseudoalteromonas mariniglutinosa NCIMB 1770]MDQ9091032.1 porin family protein [Pseudoalteromonas haloplanktis]TMN69904.1 porin family protein [Pseudoalteromonas sp. S1727]BDF93419.1 hypothetical protein KAN5_02570 [Pseudoalteromonas sp. KAN5]
MLKVIVSSMFFLAVCSTSVFSKAETKYYTGIAISSQTLKLDNEFKLYDNGEFKSTVFTPYVGYQFNQYVALEARFGFGSGNDNEVIASQPIKITDEYELENQQGLLLKLQYPLSEGFSLYATAGYFDSKFKVRSTYTQINSDFSQSSNGSFSEKGASFGVGAAYSINQNWQLSSEFQYFDQGSEKSEALSVAISYYF